MRSPGPGLPPGGRRLVAGLVALAAVKSLALVLVATGIADAIAALADGTMAWQVASILAATGVVLRAGSGWASSVVAARGAINAKTALRADLARRIVTDGSTDGSTAVLATEGLDGLDDYYGTVISTAVQAAVIPTVLLARILTADWLSALVVGLTIPLVPVFMALIGLHTRERADAASQALARLSDHLVELARGLPVLVGLGRVREQTEALSRIQTEYRERTRRTLRTAFLSSLALELIATLSVAVVAVLLGIRLLSGDLPLATALLVLLLAPDCFNVLRDLGAAFHSSQNGRSALESAKTILSRVSSKRRMRGGSIVGLDGVSVRYAGRKASALASITATFPVGQITAVAGASGAGKSTLLGVLTDTLPRDAVITGRVHGITAHAIAYSPQAPQTFARTIRGELQLYARSPEDADARLAELGLSAVAETDPAVASPGELRRVAVARALLGADRGARLLVLDEPTAHLDDESAALVRSAILRRRDRAAIVLVSHDPATLSIADAMVTLDDTVVRATRSHDEAADRIASGPVITVTRGRAGGSLPLLRALLRPDARRWVAALLWGILAIGLGLALTAVSGWLIVRAGAQVHIMYLLVAIVGVRFFGLGRSSARYLERLTTHDAVLRMVDRLRLRLWSAIAARGAASRSLAEGGSALDYLVTMATDVREALPRIFPLAVGVVAVSGVALTIGLVTPDLVDIVAPLLIGTLVVAVAAAIVRERRVGPARSQVRSDLVRQIFALGASSRDLRSNGVADRALARVAATDLRRAQVERAGAWTAGLTTAVAVLGSGLLAAAVPALSARSGVPADLAAVATLLLLATGEAIAAAAAAAQRIPALRATLAALAGVLREPNRPSGREVVRGPLQRLTIDRVSAQWPDTDAPAFADASAQVSARHWLGVHGPSGSGKSTLLTVLLGQLPVVTGVVAADAVSLAALDQSHWNDHVAWCPQEAHVFDSTIRANLLIGRPRDQPVGEGDMLEILQRVGLHPLISGMADGLDTRVGAGGNSLSGGERQRLAVARALLKNADLLLLDEPTAHLDDATAAAMMGDIRRAVGDRMVVVVSHRTADHRAEDARLTLRSADGLSCSPSTTPFRTERDPALR